ncbi:MAG: cellobiose phosphorylase [Clostridiaceae bacterium]|nr:cellobiose phosphorylase [Clostridiaceae bacterium]
MAVKYEFNESNEFVIQEYHKAKTFSSFLPGIAGIDGIPMWSFYVNRGQAMGSFGVKDKDNTIMEFFPANTMYKNVELQGFRTFIKYKDEIHEIFSSMSRDVFTRKMIIEKNVLKIQEINETLNIKVTVTYFTMPKESFAAIVRKVELENLDNEEKCIEVLDGLPQILPFGVKNSDYQAMSNLFRAWFEVNNIENNIPYYKIRGTTGDSAEVTQVSQGNFYLSFTSESQGLIKPLIDMDVIFGSNTAYTKPEGWNCSIEEIINQEQVATNKSSGGFTAAKTTLKDKFAICTIIGHIAKPELINERKNDFNFKYIEEKEKQARVLVENLVQDTFTKTSNPLFDKYVDQCYLDNILRGGYPLIIKNNKKNHVYHVYSRKHGDLEREYNFFSLEPAYYSQGNGNFRDVNQNRRSDVLFNPQVEDFNVKQFMSLIQADGYNPLSVKGSTFSLNQDYLEEILLHIKDKKDGMKDILSGKFTPGHIITYLVNNHVDTDIIYDEFLGKVLLISDQNYEAEFGEGYWTDHWTYNMDLVETYLSIYPDKLKSFAFEDLNYTFFHSPVKILKREDKYVVVNGKVRQYDALLEDHQLNIKNTNWLRSNNGKGEIYKTNLYAKLISLALNKFVTLDAYGMGIEMEANKPGWNDAMNGLPGLFGSSLNETAELKRLINFILEISLEYQGDVNLPIEMAELLKLAAKELRDYFQGSLNDFQYWDRTSTLRENYREKILYGINGEEEKFSSKEISDIFENFNKKIQLGIKHSLDYGNGIYPTYFHYEATKYDLLEGKFNPVNGYQNVKITEFSCNPLPLFLEGPCRTLKILEDKETARRLYNSIKESEIYDNSLKMYKTSVSLENTSDEIGRARAFTPGWLERESVFMHMEYKYLLALLKSELYDEFFKDIQTTLAPFLDPEVYGRSVLENSSFIASSMNPDKSTHGRGYVARLSGSTSELLSIWFLMMAGKNPFAFEDEMLSLCLSPLLPGWLFDDKGEVTFKFLSTTKVTYHNPKKLDTYAAKVEKMVLVNSKGKSIEIKGNRIGEPYASEIRNKNKWSIDVFFNEA